MPPQRTPHRASAPTTPYSASVRRPRQPLAAPRAWLLLLLTLLLVASSCADTPLAPPLGRARAA